MLKNERAERCKETVGPGLVVDCVECGFQAEPEFFIDQGFKFPRQVIVEIINNQLFTQMGTTAFIPQHKTK